MSFLTNFAQRCINKLLRIASRFIDSYSIYFNFLPSNIRIRQVSKYSCIGEKVTIKGKIITPTPFYVEIGNNVSINNLIVSPEKYVLIERDVVEEDLDCQEHSIITNKKGMKVMKLLKT